MSAGTDSTLSMTGVARVGVFAALAMGINAPFLAVPNVELFSISLFLSGIFLGIAGGSASSLVAGVIFVFFNPNGAQPVFLIGLLQLFDFFLFGLAGGMLRPVILKIEQRNKAVAILALSGAILTFWYDLSTNIAFALMFGPFWTALLAGLWFSLLHTVSNIVIFGLSGTVIRKIWKRIEYIMPSLA